jgi:hypothetical protein
MATPNSLRAAPADAKSYSSLSPEMQKAVRALREMPPFAREREINTGRYSHFSAENKQILRNAG